MPLLISNRITVERRPKDLHPVHLYQGVVGLRPTVQAE